MSGSLFQADIEFSLPSAEALGMTDEKFDEWTDKLSSELHEKVWHWPNWGVWKDEKLKLVHFSACGDDTTRDESAIVHEASAVIWLYVGQFVEVNVSTCCLENLPTEGWGADKDDYEEWMKKNLLDVVANEGKSDG